MKAQIKIFSIIFFSAVCFINAPAQDSAKNKKSAKHLLVKNMVDSQNYIFVPNYVTPMRGSRRMLSASYYFLDINKDTLNCYLPYFGRSYVAPLSSTDIMFDFASTDFQYSSLMNKKGGWEIEIKPKNQADVLQIYLTVFDDGTAWLNIHSNNRDPISFDGYLKKPKAKKK